jgi:hypothetical protein
MENTNTDSALFGFRFDENTRFNLRSLAVWAKLAAILSLAGAIVNVIEYFLSRSKTTKIALDEYGDINMETATTGSIANIIITLGIAILLFIFLFRFANEAKTGVDSGNKPLITSAFRNLSIYFKIIGIILIIALVFILLGLLIAIAS